MCGVAGFLAAPNAAPETLARLATSMAGRLQSRGPDGAGCWVSASAGIALGHRRLAVIDLSAAGSQPMQSASGCSVIAYNGEIYNTDELRQRLEGQGRRFRGTSDTEVLVEACEAWGVQRAVEQAIGMFAFAFWDDASRRLTLVRDRLGIKPMYWGRSGGVLFFGSQPKAFAAHPKWQPAVDLEALTLFLRHGYVPAPYSIYRGIEKLPPGCLVEIEAGAEPRRRRYWDLRAVARAGLKRRGVLGDGDAMAALDELLRDAVRRRMVADVPLGAFLSGGIDSSTVLALMQAQAERPVRSFTIGFEDETLNEAPYARAVAARLGTDHTEMVISTERALAVLPQLAERYDEPFADSSQMPTLLLSELARRDVTVALSGDGGDELFAGYMHHRSCNTLARLFRGWPPVARSVAAGALQLLSPAAWDALAKAVPAPLRPARTGARAHRLADLLRCADDDDAYRRAISKWRTPEQLVRGGREPAGVAADRSIRREIPAFLDRMQFYDTTTYLPDDILAKVDRASMAVGLEVRVPLLDHRVVEFSWQLPAAMRIRRGQSKWLLRQVLADYVPPALTERPKAGFEVPLGEWLRGELRDWAAPLLAEDRLHQGGYIVPAPVRQAWSALCAGEAGSEHLEGQVWSVLMFEAWRETWGIGSA